MAVNIPFGGPFRVPFGVLFGVPLGSLWGPFGGPLGLFWSLCWGLLGSRFEPARSLYGSMGAQREPRLAVLSLSLLLLLYLSVLSF